MAARLASLGPALLPALPALALFLAWSGDGGGYGAEDWYPGIFVLGGLLVVAVAALGSARPPMSRGLALALGALAAYTAWSYLSVAWAAAPGVALEGANRTLLYLLAFSLFAVLPWDERRVLVALTGWVLAIGSLGVVTAVDFGTAADAAGMFLDARLQAPLDYHNADAALWTMGMLPGLLLASRRELHPALRGAMLAAAGVCAELALLTQSRGWLITLPVVLLVVLVLVPGRVRFAASVLVAGVVVAAALPALLDVYDAGGGREGAAATADVAREATDAMWAVLASATALLAAGTLLGLADRRVELSPRAASRVGRAGAAAAIALALAAAVGGWAAVDGEPFDRLDSAWEEFKANEAPGEEDATRFADLGSTRYDFWRVALDLSGEHLLAGLGQDNYAAEYLERREALEEPRWVHSLLLRLTTHTGVVGLLLFGAFAAAAAAAALRGRPAVPRALALACIAPGAVWVVHGSVDWLWEFPALSAPAFAFAAVGGRLPREDAPPRRPRRRLAVALGVAAALALAVVAGGPYLSERAVQRGLDAGAADPVRALERLDDAAAFNPLSARPRLVAGLIAADAGRPQEAIRELRLALEREEGNWFAHFELGLVASGSGDRRLAEAEYRRALRLNPLEPVVKEALSRVESRRPLRRTDAHEQLLNRARVRVGLAPRPLGD